MMGTAQRPLVVGVFTDRHHAQRAIGELKQHGFDEDSIGVIARSEDSGKAAAPAMAAQGAVAGLVAGAGVASLWTIAIAAGLIPAVGPIIAGGVLAGLAGGAAAGAAAGGLVGALIGLGVPKSHAELFEGHVRSGRTIVTVQANGRSDEAVSIIRRQGGADISGKPGAESYGVRKASAK